MNETAVQLETASQEIIIDVETEQASSRESNDHAANEIIGMQIANAFEYTPIRQCIEHLNGQSQHGVYLIIRWKISELRKDEFQRISEYASAIYAKALDLLGRVVGHPRLANALTHGEAAIDSPCDELTIEIRGQLFEHTE